MANVQEAAIPRKCHVDVGDDVEKQSTEARHWAVSCHSSRDASRVRMRALRQLRAGLLLVGSVAAEFASRGEIWRWLAAGCLGLIVEVRGSFSISNADSRRPVLRGGHVDVREGASVWSLQRLLWRASSSLTEPQPDKWSDVRSSLGGGKVNEWCLFSDYDGAPAVPAVGRCCHERGGREGRCLGSAYLDRRDGMCLLRHLACSTSESLRQSG